MLAFVYEGLTKQQLKIPEQFVYLEGFLLHYRNLIQFFAGNPRKHRTGDLSMYDPVPWAGRQMTPEELVSIKIPAEALENQYWTDVSQFLQHCTERRYLEFQDWDVQQMYEGLEPLIAAFEVAFSRQILLPSATLGSGNSTATFS
jgi:hypothetical protein